VQLILFHDLSEREDKKREQIELVWVAEGILSFQMWDIIQPLPNYCHFHNPFSCNPSGGMNECKSQTG
jgi:hypothetical protein